MLIKDINFFERYQEVQKREKNVSKETSIQIGIIGGMIAITLVIFGGFTIMNSTIQGEIDEINNYINSPEVVEKLNVLTEKEKIFTNATNYYNGIAKATQKIQTQVKPDQKLFDDLVNLSPPGLVVEGVTFNGGSISIQCKADQDEKIAQYVHRLRMQENVFGVAYSGYNSGTEAGQGSATSINLGIVPGGVKDADDNDN